MVKMNFGISCRFCGSCTKINLFQYSFTSSVSKICNSFSSKSSHVNVVFSVTFDMVFFMLWSSFMGLIMSDYVLPINTYTILGMFFLSFPFSEYMSCSMFIAWFHKNELRILTNQVVLTNTYKPGSF